MQNTDKKILRLIDILIFEKRINYIKDFCEEVGMATQTITKIKNEQAHFTIPQIEKICTVYNVDVSWIFGFEEKIFRQKKSNQKSVQTYLIKQN